MAFLLPGIVFTVAEKLLTKPEEQTPQNQTENSTVEENERKEASVLVLSTNGEVIEMQMSEYLTGVVIGEMPTDFSEEALRAQAVVARTYARKRSIIGQKHPQGAVCMNSACCQSYRSANDFMVNGGSLESYKKVQAAVEATADEVLYYQGALIEATYFSCSGGRTEDAMAVWGTDIPYLRAQDSPGEELATHYTDTVYFTSEEFVNRLEINPQGLPAAWIGRITYTSGGGVDTIEIAGKTFEGTQLREKLGLRSTSFSVEIIGDLISVTTKGFGHRVGMSQYGAEAMAVRGCDYREILRYYYPGTILTKYSQN